MYAWKCWRDSRQMFFLFLGILAFGIVAFALLTRTWHAHAVRDPLEFMRGLRSLCAMPFVAASLFSIGTPLTQLTLTRPMPRWQIVWIAFGISAVKTASLCFLIGVIGWEFSIHSVQRYAGPSFLKMIALTVAEVALSAAILRGIFVIVTLTASRRRPALLAVALTLLPFYWYVLAIDPSMEHWTPWLPVPVPNVWAGSGMFFDYAPGLGLSFLVRTLCLLLLTFIAQKTLERREV